MKFTRKDRGMMRTLIAYGTAVGPVTQEMIDLAVVKYENACRITDLNPEEFGWVDFIGNARKDRGNCPECSSPLQDGPSLRGTFPDGTVLESADFGGVECSNPHCEYHEKRRNVK